MRLLFISFAFPLPADNGHRMRTWSVLDALATEGHQVSLITFGSPEEAETHKIALKRVCCEIEIVPFVLRSLSSTMNYFDRLQSVFVGQPYALRRFASSMMRAMIHDRLSLTSYDAIMCDALFGVVNLPKTHLPVVLNCHNVEHLILRRYVAVERNPIKRLYAWCEMQKLRQWERHACHRAAMVLTCSETDRRLLGILAPGSRFEVAPNVVDVDRHVPQEQRDAATVLFQGGMDWFPNRDAVSFFADRILPLLRQAIPNIQFVVAGRNPSPAFVDRFAAVAGIEFARNVPDMRVEIANAAVCVVPLRIGSGTRLKILEAAAMAKPVVSTRIGAEGLDFADGQEILLADDPPSFARAVADLLADPSRRRAMGLAARRRVASQYDMVHLRAALREALAHLASASNSTVFAPEMKPLQAEARP